MAAGPLNWFSQVTAVTGFSLRTLPERKGSSAAVVFGIAGVVAVMVGVLSIAHGIMRTMKSSAAPENAIVLRSGSDTEMMSGVSSDSAKIISEAEGIARYADGPIASSELFVIINLPKRSTGTDANVPLRGVVPAAFEVRDKFRLTEGRHFEWGLNEVIVGIGAAREFAGLDLGGSLEIGKELALLCHTALEQATAYAKGERSQMTFEQFNEENGSLSKLESTTLALV